MVRLCASLIAVLAVAGALAVVTVGTEGGRTVNMAVCIEGTCK